MVDARACDDIGPQNLGASGEESRAKKTDNANDSYDLPVHDCFG
jgi:hypothetical protein